MVKFTNLQNFCISMTFLLSHIVDPYVLKETSFSAKLVTVNSSDNQDVTFGTNQNDRDLLPSSAADLTLTLPQAIFKLRGENSILKVAIIVHNDSRLFPSSSLGPVVSIDIGDASEVVRVTNLSTPIIIDFGNVVSLIIS